MISGVDGFVCADGHGQELSGELQDGLVFEDDGTAADASPLYTKSIQTLVVIARRNLLEKCYVTVIQI